jgi:signal transduction histidine kinase
VCAEKGLSFQLDAAPEIAGRWRADGMRVRQILTNLVSNTVKFTDEGSVVVTARADGDEFVVEVVDSGCGISEDRLVRVFESFAQADASTTRHYGGNGLGLAIARQLPLMGGTLSMVSEVGACRSWTARAPREIRDRERATGRRRTPIVALTANALSHQTSAYLAGGMDGVVTKPIEAGSLIEALLRVADEAAAEEPGPGAAESA